MTLVPPESEEVDIYEELHQLDPASPNHTLPCDVIRSETKQPFLIMPCLEKIWEDQERWRWGPVPLLDFFHQVLEVRRVRTFDGQKLTRHMYVGPGFLAPATYCSYGEWQVSCRLRDPMTITCVVSGHI